MKLFFLVLLLSDLARPVRAQAPLSEKTQGHLLEASSFIDALLKIASRFEIRLAVEWVKSADTLKPVVLSTTNATAHSMLDAVVSSHDGYTWRPEDGIVTSSGERC